MLAMSGALDYEQKELRSNEEHVSAVLRMAWAELLLLFIPFTVTFANPCKIRFANGICSYLNHFLTDFAVNAKSCVNSNELLQIRKEK